MGKLVTGKYDADMVASMYVGVPQELADHLVEDGFRVAGVKRGVDLVEVTQVATGLGANFVTILLARYQIPTFVRRLWKSARRGTTTGRIGAQVVIELEGERTAITFEHQHTGDDEPPEVLFAALAAFFEKLVDSPTDTDTGKP
jgi:hypothetical protein